MCFQFILGGHSIVIRNFVRENLFPCTNPQAPVTNYLWLGMLPPYTNDSAAFRLYLTILCDISMCLSFIIEGKLCDFFFSGKKQNSSPQKIDLGLQMSPILGKKNHIRNMYELIAWNLSYCGLGCFSKMPQTK